MSYTKLQDILLQHKSNISLPFEHEYGEHWDLSLLLPKYKSKLEKKIARIALFKEESRCKGSIFSLLGFLLILSMKVVLEISLLSNKWR